MRKAHSQQLESYGVRTGQGSREDLTINFEHRDLERVVTPYDDALVVHVTIANYEIP